MSLTPLREYWKMKRKARKCGLGSHVIPYRLWKKTK